jgi:hypothetical protein
MSEKKEDEGHSPWTEEKCEGWIATVKYMPLHKTFTQIHH